MSWASKKQNIICILFLAVCVIFTIGLSSAIFMEPQNK